MFICHVFNICNVWWQVEDFERNGLDLSSSKREELQHLRAQIDELSMQYIRNLNDNNTILFFTDMELVGLPSEFLKVGNNDKFFLL